MKTVISGENQLIWEDVKKWAKNLLIFSSGSIIIALVVLQQGGTIQEAAIALYGALINAVIDIFGKWKTEIKYTSTSTTKML